MKYVISILIVLSLFACDKDSVQIQTSSFSISRNLRDNFLFNEDSYWIYQDSLLNIDSITLSSVETGLTPLCPIDDCDMLEFFTLNYKNQTQNTTYNHYYVSNFIKYNGGGDSGEKGQPIYNLGGESINGLIIFGKLDSLEVLSTFYFDVQRMSVIADEQIQPEFTFDTDFYFSPNIGIVRMVVHDTINGPISWDLKRFDIK